METCQVGYMMKATPLAFQGEERDGFRFRGGHNAIDLPATVQGRLKPKPRELLNTPADLDRWLIAANLSASAPNATDEDLRTAHQLREVIYALASARLSGETDTSEARAALNRLASGSPAAPVLSGEGTMELVGSAASLLVTLAREAIHLFGGREAVLIRQCASETCTLFFIDTSRSGDRKWCSMSGCGNKAKVAEFRRRKRRVEPPQPDPD